MTRFREALPADICVAYDVATMFAAAAKDPLIVFCVDSEIQRSIKHFTSLLTKRFDDPSDASSEESLAERWANDYAYNHELWPILEAFEVELALASNGPVTHCELSAANGHLLAALLYQRILREIWSAAMPRVAPVQIVDLDHTTLAKKLCRARTKISARLQIFKPILSEYLVACIECEAARIVKANHDAPRGNPLVTNSWSKPDYLYRWAKKLGISKSTFLRRVESGEIEIDRIGGPNGKYIRIPNALVPKDDPKP